jgi:hypothetical protein
MAGVVLVIEVAPGGPAAEQVPGAGPLDRAREVLCRPDRQFRTEYARRRIDRLRILITPGAA